TAAAGLPIDLTSLHSLNWTSAAAERASPGGFMLIANRKVGWLYAHANSRAMQSACRSDLASQKKRSGHGRPWHDNLQLPLILLLGAAENGSMIISHKGA